MPLFFPSWGPKHSYKMGNSAPFRFQRRKVQSYHFQENRTFAHVCIVNFAAFKKSFTWVGVQWPPPLKSWKWLLWTMTACCGSCPQHYWAVLWDRLVFLGYLKTVLTLRKSTKRNHLERIDQSVRTWQFFWYPLSTRDGGTIRLFSGPGRAWQQLICASCVCLCRWYHGVITRDQAELLLRNQIDRSFLVRISESCRTDYSLSLKWVLLVRMCGTFICSSFSFSPSSSSFFFCKYQCLTMGVNWGLARRKEDSPQSMRKINQMSAWTSENSCENKEDIRRRMLTSRVECLRSSTFVIVFCLSFG